VNAPTLRGYRSGDRTCTGMKVGVAIQSVEGAPISPGGNGRARLLAVHVACVPWAAHHPSRGDCTVVQGVSKDSMASSLDEVRRRMAQLSREEQSRIKFKDEMLVKLDECGIGAERVSYTKPWDKNKPECPGYRLRWNRWLIMVERGNRANMFLIQLPWETSMAGGGGVPLSGAQCDEAVKKHLGRGAIALTDGADCHEAFAAGQRGPPSNALGHGRDRLRAHYRKLPLSHGVVGHKKEERAVVKAARVQDRNGNVRMVTLKHGTEAADGSWGKVTTALPSSIKSADHDRIAEYVHAWAGEP
ncbi:unnamed protein product, partial [Prorocentrum cordatum]